MFGFNKKKEEPVQVKAPVVPFQRKLTEKNMKRELDAVTRQRNQITQALGLGGAFVGGDINQVINRTLQRRMIESRYLAVENPIAKKYASVSTAGVCGSSGLYIRPDVHIHSDSERDSEINQYLENAFYKWAESPDRFDVASVLDISTFQAQLENTRAICGEAFARFHIINGELRIEMIDPLSVPFNNNKVLSDGRYVSNGIEYDRFRRPIAYYIMQYSPSTYSYISGDPERVPADEMIHYFVPSFPNQERGMPDITACVSTLKELDKFLGASLMSKLVGASSMAFIETSDTNDSEVISNRSGVEYYENEYLNPGSIVTLQPGQSIKSINPQAATDGLEVFIKQQMNLIAMSLNISVQALTGDVSGASYSASKLSERIQASTFGARINQMQVKVLKPLYIRWLRQAMLNNTVKGIKFSDFDNASTAQYISQTTTSIEPVRDAQYQQILLQMGVKSKQQIISELGNDPAVVFAQIEKETAGKRYETEKENINNGHGNVEKSEAETESDQGTDSK